MKTTHRPKRAKLKAGHIIHLGEDRRVEVISVTPSVVDVLIFAPDHITIAKQAPIGDTDSLTT